MSDVGVYLVGNITRDPEVRFTPGGVAVASFGLAVNRRFQRDGQWEEQTSFFDVVAYNTLAENVSESLQRGTRVIVTGRLEQRSWETKEGDKRSKVEVVADEVGPSLRWATAEVTKTERSDNGNSHGNGHGREERSSGRRPARTASRPAPRREERDYDEEPF